jgi:hypothetical protein
MAKTPSIEVPDINNFSKQIDAWRATQSPIPPRATAIRALALVGIAFWEEGKPTLVTSGTTVSHETRMKRQ